MDSMQKPMTFAQAICSAGSQPDLAPPYQQPVPTPKPQPCWQPVPAPVAQLYQQPVPTLGLQPYQQPVPTLGLQPYQQPVPAPELSREMKWEERVNYQCQRDAYLLRERAGAEIFKHDQKRQIDAIYDLHKMQAREDIHIKREMLAETILLTESGEIIRRQEYFLRRPEDFSLVNFRVIGRPIRYFSRKSNNEVLYLAVRLQNQTEQTLYLNLESDSAAYLWRKFRKAGIALKKKRKEKKDLIFDVVAILTDLAEIVELPDKRGFFMTRDGHLCYADKASLTWKEALENAR